MDTYKLKLILAVSVILVLILLMKQIFSNVTKRDAKIDKRRTTQLDFDKRTSSQDMSTADLLNLVTTPATRWIMPSLSISDTRYKKLEEQITLADWKGFDPILYTALDITLKIVGFTIGGIFATSSLVFGLVWIALLGFGPQILFRNSINNRRFGLLQEFPDLIRITQGFLMSGMPLPEAFENALPYAGTFWHPILEEFLINANIYSQNDCLEMLKKKVPIFEVNEFFALLQLNLEQGIDIRECFGGQAEKIKAMQREIMMKKIQGRQTMATAVQAPLMLCMMGGFMLPTIANMMNMGSLMG